MTTRSPTSAASSDGDGDRDGDVMTFAALWDSRDERVGQRTTVDAKVFYRLDCASPSATGRPCVATAFLTDEATEDLPLYEETPAFALYLAGRAVTCGTPTLGADFECHGFRHDTGVRITGSIQHLVLGGRTTEDLIFEVENKGER